MPIQRDMKWLAVVAVLIIGGFVGIVATHESRTSGSSGGSSGSSGGGGKVATISHGETVTIEDHLSSGIYTIVEFTADW